MLFLQILGFSPETAWRAWRCRQAAHKCLPKFWVLSRVA